MWARREELASRRPAVPLTSAGLFPSALQPADVRFPSGAVPGS